ncbi:hypothetical protein L7F22_005287 [Adiantum nelumboides]|nr:hypothetical protein [Adiantum nelumboides]
MKIEEVNVTRYGSDSDFGIATGDIFLTSNFDSIFLTAEDVHAMSDWIINSGASLHVFPHKEWFTSYVATIDYVRLGNEQVCDILGVGDVQLKFLNGSSLWLKNVRHVPAIRKSLISIGKLDDAGYVTIFGNSAWKISKGSMTVAHDSKSRTLYTV